MKQNLQRLLLESDSEIWDDLLDDTEIKKKRKALFFKEIKNIKQYNQSIIRQHPLQDISKKLVGLSKMAEDIILNETDDWFDAITLKNDTKQLMNSCALFEQTAKEVSTLEFRLTSAYDDIMQKLNKYFDIDSDDDLTESNKKKQKLTEKPFNLSKSNIQYVYNFVNGDIDKYVSDDKLLYVKQQGGMLILTTRFQKVAKYNPKEQILYVGNDAELVVQKQLRDTAIKFAKQKGMEIKLLKSI